MKRENDKVTAGEVSARARRYATRATLQAGTTLSVARTTLRACATLSRGIPFVPLNPGESRIKILRIELARKSLLNLFERSRGPRERVSGYV